MSFDLYKRIIQKDVNNYVAVDYEGEYKSKGAYVKGLNDLDNDLPIVNKAMMDYMLKNIPVEKTINDCNDLKEFQKIVKVSNKYICGYHNGKRLTDKTFRVFASKNTHDGIIGKVKDKNGKVIGFTTPELQALELSRKLVEVCKDKTLYVALLALTKTETVLRNTAVCK